MWDYLRRLTAPPIFEGDEEQTRLAAVLNSFLWTFLTSLAVYTLLAVTFFVVRKAAALLIMAVLVGIWVGAWFLLQKGRVHLASFVWLAALWILSTVVTLLGGGLRGPGGALYLSIPAFAGLMLGRRGALAALGLCGLTLAGVAGLEATGHLPAEYFIPAPGGSWTFLMLVMVWVFIPLNVAQRGLRQALAAAQEQLAERVRAEEALRESERKVRATFDLTFGFIGLLTPDGLVVEANRTALEFAGVQLSDVVGKPFWETPWWNHSPEMQDRIRAAVRAVADGKLMRFEATHRATDGTLHTIDVSLKPVVDETGRVVLLIPEGRNITERRRAEEERETLHSQLIHRTQQLEAVGRVSAEITRELDLDRLLALILQRAAELVNANSGAILFWDEAAQVLVHQQHIGYLNILGFQQIPIGQSAVGRVAATRHGLIVNDYQTWPDAIPALATGIGVTALMAEPLLYRDTLVGVIVVERIKATTTFTDRDASLLRLFADQAAIAIENARLYEELKQSYGRLQSLATRAAEAEEAERRRMARELHDQVGQNLSALGLNLTMLQAQGDVATDTASQSRLADSLTLVERTGAAIRSVMADLRPGVLDDYGLVAALRWLSDEMAARAGIVVDVQGEECVPRLAAPVENTLFRIAQEAVTNVTKHAQASEVTVSIEAEEKVVRLLIADNGIGFDPAAVGSPQGGYHWGLSAMAERALGVGGRCRIESRPGKGTHVIVEVPR